MGTKNCEVKRKILCSKTKFFVVAIEKDFAVAVSFYMGI